VFSYQNRPPKAGKNQSDIIIQHIAGNAEQRSNHPYVGDLFDRALPAAILPMGYR
jgi:hypothetical protein